MAHDQRFWPDVRCSAAFYAKRWSGLHLAGNLLRSGNYLNFVEVSLHFICQKLD